MSNPDQLVRDFAAAWGRGDTEAILATFTDDAVYHNIPMDPLSGKDEIRAFLDGILADGITFEIHHQVVAGNIVMNERTDTLVLGDSPVSLPVMGVFEVEGDKIKAWRDYFDMAQFTGG
jgi:limonene-1,2-epoxide hydrolase